MTSVIADLEEFIDNMLQDNKEPNEIK
jgi:hypothetical protein